MEIMTDEELVAHLKEKLFEPASRLRGVPLTERETGDMLRLLSAAPEQLEAIWQKALGDGIWEFQVVETVAARFRRPTGADAKLFLCLIVESPGDAVLYLSFAHQQMRDRRKADLTLGTLCDIFPAGFWSKEDRRQLWEAQKLPAMYGTANGLDTKAVRAWINDGEPAAASGMGRAEHLAWAKQRALAALDAGGQTEDRAVSGAFTSLASDLGKHPETEGHPGLHLGMMEMLGGFLATREKMRRHIEGYN